MKKLIISLLLIPALSHAQESSISSQGSCSKSVAADQVEISATIAAQSMDYDEAVKNSQKDYNKISIEFKKNPELKVKTSLSIQEEFNWENNTQVFKGIKSQYLLVIEAPQDQTNKLINLLNQHKVKVNQVSWKNSEATRQKVVEECLVEAAAQARRYGEKLAQGLGVSLGVVKSSSFSINTPQGHPYPMMMKSAGSKMEGDSQVLPAELETRVDLQVVFSIKGQL